MNATNETVKVARGIVMPFFPMRPRSGSPLRTIKQVEELVAVLDDGRWIVQPKAGGHRACLAVVDGKVWVQNRHGKWYAKPVKNAQDFLKLPNRTCFDGEVLDGSFYPFECLADSGKSMLFRPASEREVVAFQFSKFLHHDWKFRKPSPKFLRQMRHNLPTWEGVVLKEYMSLYVVMASEAQHSNTWLKRIW
jgi:ATP-dependent DNA ligase